MTVARSPSTTRVVGTAIAASYRARGSTRSSCERPVLGRLAPSTPRRRSSPICAPRSARPVRVPSRSSSRCTPATRASREGRAVAVCFPRSGDEVAAAVRVARRHGRPFVARGSGTGLAGGATPLDDPLVIVTTRMNRVLEVDPHAARRVGRARRAQPRPRRGPSRTSGCTTRPTRRRSRPARSAATSRTNAGGPHCLAVRRHLGPRARGRRRARRRRRSTRLGGLEPDQPGYDLRGCFVGSEGTMGIATRIAVRLTPDPPAVATHAVRVRLDRRRGGDGHAAHRGRRAARRARDDGRAASPARSRTSSAPATPATRRRCCSSRSTASHARCRRAGRRDRARIGTRTTARRACASRADDAERALLWKGRKSAFGAIARIAPDYYLHDAVVPAHEARRGAAARLRDRRRARAHR